jgi:hypothetical protein
MGNMRGAGARRVDHGPGADVLSLAGLRGLEAVLRRYHRADPGLGRGGARTLYFAGGGTLYAYAPGE